MVTVFIFTKPFDSQGHYIHFLSRWWTKIPLNLQLGWNIKVDGLENIDKKSAYVIVVNHQSMLDIPLIYHLPLNFKWVSKREVYYIPIIGWILKMHCDIVIKRGASKDAKKIIIEGGHWLKAGTSIVIFPEGTRTKDGEIGRFKDGAFLLAKSANVAILPCVIDGSATIWESRWSLRRKHQIKVRILPPISQEEVQNTGVRILATKVQHQIKEAHNILTDRG